MSSLTKLPELLLRGGLLIGLIYCIYLEGARGISAWYLRQTSPAALETAIAWDPGNPQNFDDLGTLTHAYGEGADQNKIVTAYEEASQLSPQNAQYWADLGAAYDWAGRSNDALIAFHRAEQLFPNSPDINWRVANFCIRTGKTDEALPLLRKVLASSSLGESVSRRDVFALATNATQDNPRILSEVLPPQNSIFVDYLNFQIGRGDIDSAQETWRRLLELNLTFAERDIFPYLDALIAHRKLAEATEAWSLLTRRFPSQNEGAKVGDTESNLVTNGSFEREPLNGGFDWRIVPVKGATVTQDIEERFDGARSLRIDFDSTENLDYWHVFQYVRVNPLTRYHFSGQMRTQGITTDSGPMFEVYDPFDMKKPFVSGLSGHGPVGTSGWEAQEFDFKTAAGTELLVLRVGRRPSEKIDNRIGGTVWIDKIAIERKD